MRQHARTILIITAAAGVFALSLIQEPRKRRSPPVASPAASSAASATAAPSTPEQPSRPAANESKEDAAARIAQEIIHARAGNVEFGHSRTWPVLQMDDSTRWWTSGQIFGGRGYGWSDLRLFHVVLAEDESGGIAAAAPVEVWIGERVVMED